MTFGNDVSDDGGGSGGAAACGGGGCGVLPLGDEVSTQGRGKLVRRTGSGHRRFGGGGLQGEGSWR